MQCTRLHSGVLVLVAESYLLCHNSGDWSGTMAGEYPSVDISHDPELLKLAEEVRTTNRPRILKRADEDIAVIAPIRKAAKRQPDKRAAVSGIPHYTLEQVFGSVPTPPHLQGMDIDEMIREAKEERAQRTMQTMR
jgi:hypothetical protein